MSLVNENIKKKTTANISVGNRHENVTELDLRQLCMKRRIFWLMELRRNEKRHFYVSLPCDRARRYFSAYSFPVPSFILLAKQNQQHSSASIDCTLERIEIYLSSSKSSNYRCHPTCMLYNDTTHFPATSIHIKLHLTIAIESHCKIN